MRVPSVYAIVVNWNGKRDTLECLQSLFKVQTTLASLTIVVVDNDSHDGSVTEIQKKYPHVVCLTLSDNIGFSGANNRGISYAIEHNADFIWLLNNDTIVDKYALSAIQSFADPKVGGIGSKIYFYKGREFHKDMYKKQDLGHVIWYAGGVVDWSNMLASHRGVDEVDTHQFDYETETDYITGCSFFIRASCIQTVGFFDESFFMYMEDLDYSLRLHRKGYTTIFNPYSRLWHKNASSTGGVGSSTHQYYQTRNRLKIGLTYAPIRTKLALIREAIRMIFVGPRMKRKAVIDYFFGRMGQ